MVSLVEAHNEWDQLEEIIVGTAMGGRIPESDPSLWAIEFPGHEFSGLVTNTGISPSVLAETEDELEFLASELESLGITVRRPAKRDHSLRFSTPDWSTTGFHDYCPRDGTLIVGNTIIEAPMVLRSRAFDSLAYKELFIEYFRSGAKWISAPRPRLTDDQYDVAGEVGSRLGSLEPCFDAANVSRLGADLLYLRSDSGNKLGQEWLQSAVGDEYTVHDCTGIYASTHIDSTIVPLRPGLVLLNPSRINDQNLPAPLKNWDKMWCPDLVDIGYEGAFPRCSVWIGMNILSLSAQLVVIDRRQKDLIRAIEALGIDVLPLQLTHARTMGGGFHCATLDIRRKGNGMEGF